MPFAISKAGRDNPLMWPFLGAFVISCVLFWWLQPIVLRMWLRVPSLLETRIIWTSAAALAIFVLGYLLPSPEWKATMASKRVLDRCQAFAYWGAILGFVPALVVAIQFSMYRAGLSGYYGVGEGPSTLQQLILYSHLFCGLMYVGLVPSPIFERVRLLTVVCLTVAPRLAISLHWGRFFVAQAIVPIAFIAISRRWIEIDVKWCFVIALIAVFIFFVPALNRGDQIFGKDRLGSGYPQFVNYLGYMNSLRYFQENMDLTYECPPIVVSFTAKLIPYPLLGICTIDVGSKKNVTATLDRLVTKRYSDYMINDGGSSYLLELYLAGGMTAITLGSVLFGFSCRIFVGLLHCRSLYAGIWAECLSRALMAPRGTLGYVYEKIPFLFLVTLVIVVLVRSLAGIHSISRDATTVT
jgi:hypothetical protein